MRTSIRIAGIAALAAAALASVHPAAQQPNSRPNVVLITLDTFRADRIGAYGYKLASTPNLDRLAREGIRFDDATTQSPLTGPAHAALLTGQYPTRLGVKINAATAVPESATTLAESFKGAGYRTAGFVGAFILGRQYGYAQGFDTFDSNFKTYRAEDKTYVQRSADEVLRPALQWISHPESPGSPAPRPPNPPAPFFAWIHFYDAHAPYAAPAPFGAKFAGRAYDGEIAYVDSAVGKVLAALSSAGAMDRTIVVAVGDHGEALGDHGEEEHGIFLYEAVLRIPWIVRLPRGERAGTAIAEQVRSIDLAPTLLELAGLPAGRFDGESLAAVMRGQSRRDPPPSYADAHFPQLNFGWSMLRSLRVGEWKYVDAPKPELYDLRTDRLERRNVLADRGSVAARMAGELRSIEKGFGPAAEATTPQPDPETLARLRSLGYVGIAAPSSRQGRGADPKDKIGEFNRFKALLGGAIGDLGARRSDAAIAKLKSAVAINERAYDVHILLGEAWMQKKDYERALGEFDAAALLNPDIASPHIFASQVFIEQGLFDRAFKRLDSATRIEPGSSDVALARGRVYERAGRNSEALAEYQRAVAINPSDNAARARLASVAMTLRQFDVAEPHLRILLEAKHQLPRTHYALGVVAEARGDRAAAAAEYRKALALDPTFAPAREALARVKG